MEREREKGKGRERERERDFMVQRVILDAFHK
jgi:hypothetical protein